MEEGKRIIPEGEIGDDSDTTMDDKTIDFDEKRLLDEDIIVYDDEVRENLRLLSEEKRRFIVCEGTDEIDFYFIPPEKPSFKDEVVSAIDSLCTMGFCADGDAGLAQRGIVKIFINSACQDFRCRTAVIDKMLRLLRD